MTSTAFYSLLLLNFSSIVCHSSDHLLPALSKLSVPMILSSMKGGQRRTWLAIRFTSSFAFLPRMPTSEILAALSSLVRFFCLGQAESLDTIYPVDDTTSGHFGVSVRHCFGDEVIALQFESPESKVLAVDVIWLRCLCNEMGNGYSIHQASSISPSLFSFFYPPKSPL